MYRGFNFVWQEDQEKQIFKLNQYIKKFGEVYDDGYFYNETNKLKEAQKLYVSKKNASGILLDGDKIEDDCFPELDANIFLSHSHYDEPVALRIKFLLEKVYRQKVFIDSCAWSYCNDLLKELDDQYCTDDDGFYNYQKRNNSTAVVHMMLSTALMKMMDKTECVIFLNTRNSNLEEAYNSKVQTASPWIYHELSMTHVLRKHINRKLDEDVIKHEASLQESVSVVHTVSMEHLPIVDMRSFFSWLSATHSYSNRNDVIDELYRRFPKI